jgi:hypothetical protein
MEKAAVVAELEEKIAALNAKRIRAERYLKALSDRNGPMTQFEPLAWQAVVHHATISRDGTVTFSLRDGSEEKEYMPNGVRQYRKQALGTQEGFAL